MTRAVTWLGHATTLLEVGGVRLLTDPLLRPRLAHLTRRVPVLEPGRVDAVLLSHAHGDHLDLASLRTLGPDVPIVGPVGAARLLGGLGPMRELRPGASLAIGGVTVRATRAEHLVVRRRRRVPAVGYVVDGDLYFAGDTGLFDGMADLAPLRLALLPVWGWGPTLGPGHLDPAGAAEALALLRPELAVPIHWGTYFPFGLPDRGLLSDPPREFARRAAEAAPGTRVAVLAPGERLEL